MNSEQKSEIGAKLDILIRLQATSMIDKYDTQKEKIIFLNKVGLSPKDIANIIGSSPNTVSVTLSKVKKAGGSNGEGKE